MDIPIHLDATKVYESGAKLLTVVACARRYDDIRQLEVYRSLCGAALRLKYQVRPDDETPIMAVPHYVFRSVETINRDVAFVGKRVGERMVAGRMAVPFLQQVELGELPKLPEDLPRLSVNAMASFTQEDAGQSDPENVKKRVWAPSRPVIHLCAAMAFIGQAFEKAAVHVPLETFLFNAVIIEHVIKLAERYAALIEQDPKFPVRHTELIRLRLT